MSLISKRGLSAARMPGDVGMTGPLSAGTIRLPGDGSRTGAANALNRSGRLAAGTRAEPRQFRQAGLPAHVFVLLTRLADVALLLVSGWLASRMCDAIGAGVFPGEPVLATIGATAATLSILNRADAYAPSRLRNASRRLRVLCGSLAVGGAVGLLCFALMPSAGHTTRWWPVLWMVSAGVLTGSAAALTARAARALSNAESLARRVVVVGVSEYSMSFISAMTADPEKASTFVGLYNDGQDTVTPISDIPVLGNIVDLVARCRRDRVDAIVLALPLSDDARIKRARAALRSVTADIFMAGELLEHACKSSKLDRVGPNAVIKIGSRPLTEWESVEKSAFDWAVAAVLLIGALPFLGLIALAIRLDSPGPVLFRQPRLGFNNNMFDVFKFRTMYHHMADLKADRQTTKNDSRVTRIGRLLRKTSLDEVPQLLNVLRGEMSLVGPRPHAPNTKAGNQLFHDAVADYALRHRVKPGITGWAQVNGWRGETRTLEQIEQRVAHDLFYIDNWSFLLDIKIMVLTALRELHSKAAY